MEGNVIDSHRCPTVSVIVCVFNGARYLETALDSALSQTFADLEVIVVDDGSTDGSKTIAEARARNDPRLRLLSQENQGAVAALATGLAAARGGLIAFLDQDDYWHRESLVAHVAHLNQHSEVDLTFSWFQYVNSEGREIGLASHRFEGAVNFQGLLEDFVIGATSNVTARRAAIERAGGVDRGVPRLYDFDLFLRIALLSPRGIAVLPRDLMYYRRHGAQITRNFATLEQEWEAVVAKLRRLAPGPVTAAEGKARSNVRRYYARLAYESRCYRQALGYVTKGFQAAPGAFLADRRNWLTLAACLSGALLPAPVHGRLERLAGLRRGEFE